MTDIELCHGCGQAVTNTWNPERLWRECEHCNLRQFRERINCKYQRIIYENDTHYVVLWFPGTTTVTAYCGEGLEIRDSFIRFHYWLHLDITLEQLKVYLTFS